MFTNNILSNKNIIKDNHKDIRKISEPVKLPMSDEDKDTLIAMRTYLEMGYDDELAKKYDIAPGVGIAAPQIDVLKTMFVVMAYDEHDEYHEYLVVNPKIISESVNTCYLEGGEGCLSVPERHVGLIHRPAKIKINCALLDPETRILHEDQELTLKGYIAIVFQHENDHLSGVLYYDHINKIDPFNVPENSKPVKFN